MKKREMEEKFMDVISFLLGINLVLTLLGMLTMIAFGFLFGLGKALTLWGQM